MRLDAYLAKNRPEFSRAVWQKYIEAGYVSIDGKKATKTAQVSDESKISIDIPEINKKPLDLPVIYEDDNVAVINKPAGVLTHSKGALNDEFTVSDFIKTKSNPKGRTRGIPEVIEQKPQGSDPWENNRFGVVHRLDRETSGVMVGAKTPEVLKFLQKQFANRKVKKAYLAVVVGVPKDDEFVIDLPIGRNPRKPATFRVDPKGKSAVTEVKVLKKFDDNTALLELKPRTGRTHQLRVHLAHIGLPIVGDGVYGSKEARMMLHASELEITLPGGDRKVFRVQTPKEFDGKSVN